MAKNRKKKRVWKRDKAKKFKWVTSPLGFLRVEGLKLIYLKRVKLK